MADQIQQGTVSVAEILAYVEQDRYMKKGASAAYLGFSRRKLDDVLSQIPHYRVDGMVLFRKSELDAWMAQQRVAAPDEELKSVVDEVLIRLAGRES